MVAIYDYTNFPIIKVDLSGNISTNDDFQNFTSQWLDLYKLNQNFEFEFDLGAETTWQRGQLLAMPPVALLVSS